MSLLNRLFQMASIVCVWAYPERQRNGSGCLTRFRRDRADFKPCLSRVCFLFLDEKPFVQIDPRMKTEEHQKLFRCDDRLKEFQNLEGIAFDIHNEMNLSPDPLCVWAGANCTFNNMVDFVFETARANATKDYQLAISGFLTVLPRRVTEFTIPTAPYVESQVIILGPSRDTSANPAARAFHEALQPFHHLTWIILTCIIFLFTILALIIAIVFSIPSTGLNILGNLFADRVRDRRYNNDFTRNNSPWGKSLLHLRLLNRASVLILGVSVSSFVIIVILFYEISVVNFIFSAKPQKIGKNVTSLNEKELRTYSVIKGTAEESVWREAVDPEEKKFPTEASYPWYRCKGIDDCYEKLLDQSFRSKYMITYVEEASYELKRRQACDRITMYETKKPLSVFSGGWYVGKGVPLPARAEIDQQILRLKQQDKMREIIEKKVKGLQTNCKSNNRHIGPEVLAIPLIFIVGPCVLTVALLLCYGCAIRCRMFRITGEGE